MRLNIFIFIFAGIGLLSVSNEAIAWGEDGHRIVGTVALSQLDSQALRAVTDILGSDSAAAVSEACNWPDVVRKTPEWEWSAPQHYVNIPRNAVHFERQRDCGDGMCVTDAIIKYANELTRAGLTPGRRWQAFAWLCHLVGDLHQPLHTGYKDDLGANLVEIEYRGDVHDLHQFWDQVVIQERLGPGGTWDRPLSDARWYTAPPAWNPVEVAAWTDESHELVNRAAYPSGRMVDQQFADQAWVIIRQQWQKAANRLAQILNATLGAGEVQLD
jgi:hypothetical protein